MRRTMPASILRNSECCDGRCQDQEAENCVFHTYPLTAWQHPALVI